MQMELLHLHNFYLQSTHIAFGQLKKSLDFTNERIGVKDAMPAVIKDARPVSGYPYNRLQMCSMLNILNEKKHCKNNCPNY